MITGVNANTFQKLQLNEGVFLKAPYEGTLNAEDIVSATRGGATIAIVPTQREIAIDGLRTHTKEALILDDFSVTASFVAVEYSKEVVKMALGSADEVDNTITPRHKILTASDFVDLYWLGELSDGRKVQIKFSNTYSTNGLNFKSTEKSTGEITLNFTAFYSIDDQETPPVSIEYLSNECVVTFDVTPSDATIVVKDEEGVTVTATSEGVYTLTIGKYTYTISKTDYVTQTVSVNITNLDAFTGTKTITVTLLAS